MSQNKPTFGVTFHQFLVFTLVLAVARMLFGNMAYQLACENWPDKQWWASYWWAVYLPISYVVMFFVMRAVVRGVAVSDADICGASGLWIISPFSIIIAAFITLMLIAQWFMAWHPFRRKETTNA